MVAGEPVIPLSSAVTMDGQHWQDRSGWCSRRCPECLSQHVQMKGFPWEKMEGKGKDKGV